VKSVFATVATRAQSHKTFLPQKFTYSSCKLHHFIAVQFILHAYKMVELTKKYDFANVNERDYSAHTVK
jgi:hypothetical protein